MKYASQIYVMMVLVTCALLTRATAAAPSADVPRGVLKGIEAMRRLPVDGVHIVESQGRLLLVSTNGHYVVSGGKIIDLWNQIEIKSVADVEATTRIPLARMGIDAGTLGGVTVGQESGHQRVTAFVDPLSPQNGNLLAGLRELGKSHRVDVVFVPAKPARAGTIRALICDRRAALAFINDGRIPPALEDSNDCGQKQLERARVTVQLLGIATLPFTVAPNGASAAGVPKNYIEFVIANGSTP